MRHGSGRPAIFVFFVQATMLFFAVVVDALFMAGAVMLLFPDHTICSRVYDSAGDTTGPRAGASRFWGVLSMKCLESQERPTNTYLPPRRKSA